MSDPWGDQPWSQLSARERLEWTLDSARMAVPGLVTALSILIMALPFGFPTQALPQVALLGVIYWSCTRPDLMPPIAAFLIGLLQDLWLGTALGVNAALLALTAFLLRSQILVFVSRPFGFTWAVATGFVVVYQFLSWSLAALADPPTRPLVGFALQALTSIALYPLAAQLHARLQRRVIDRR
jgi:rod shape-determining protein MreD